MKLTVKHDENGEEKQFEVDANKHTVLNLKEMIAENHFGPQLKEQRLEINGKRMKNKQLIAKYPVKEDTVIILKEQSASSSSCSSTSSNSE